MKTPVVTAETVKSIKAKFTPTINPDVCTQNNLVAGTAYRVATATDQVTLLPLGSTAPDQNQNQNAGFTLPNTGGISAWYLIAALLLLAVGGAGAWAGRRRSTHSG